jgi:hypothetical protein
MGWERGDRRSWVCVVWRWDRRVAVRTLSLSVSFSLVVCGSGWRGGVGETPILHGILGWGPGM